MDRKEIERTAGLNRAEWLDVVDHADETADRLDALAALLATSDNGFSGRITSGIVSIIGEGVDEIRALSDHISTYHKSCAATVIDIRQAKTLADAANMTLEQFYALLVDQGAPDAC